MDAGEYWPGRGIEIESDMPELPERKFWARVYLDTARAIMEGEVGATDNRSWQTRMIYVTYAIGLLFVRSVSTAENGWFPATRDVREESEYLAALRSNDT